MMVARPESTYHSNAGVLMSQPLKPSWARRPSSRYTPGAFGPPLWNCTLMSRPIPADGTMRYSTGRPGREKAPAVAEPPKTPTRPGSTMAASATTVSRRAHAPRILPTNFMLHLSHLLYAAHGYLSYLSSDTAACPRSQPHLAVFSPFDVYRPWSLRSR